MDEKLNNLKVPEILPGKNIYFLWKKLLERWLSNSASEVYLASPFIDCKRLLDICSIVIKFPKANIKAFYVRDDDKPDNIITQIKKMPEDNKNVINKYVFKTLRIAKKANAQFFHAKFIGCTNGSDAWALLTSANFKHGHFEKDQLDWVVYHEMTKTAFQKKFIDPIELVYQKK